LTTECVYGLIDSFVQCVPEVVNSPARDILIGRKLDNNSIYTCLAMIDSCLFQLPLRPEFASILAETEFFALVSDHDLQLHRAFVSLLLHIPESVRVEYGDAW
jgi:hypothetical protein